MSKLSVKMRVTLWYAAVMIVIATVLFIAMESAGRRSVMNQNMERLRRTVDDTSMHLVMPNGRFNLPPDFKPFNRGVQLAVYDENFNLIGGQIPFGIKEEFEYKDKDFRTTTYDGVSYYEYDRKVNIKNDSYCWVKGIMSATDTHDTLNTVTKTNILFIALMILFAACGGYFILKRAFVPVTKISSTAKEISESSDLSRRINIGGGNDEISSLANTFDDMLSKLEEVFESEKQFTSDASHELRTPVAVIMSECEYMIDCAKTRDEFLESGHSIKRQAEKMSKLISELLMISRMDKRTLRLDFEDVDISELVTFVADEQEEIRNKNILLERDIQPSVTAKADKLTIARLFINLIANAYQYTPDGGRVKITLKDDDVNVFFSVSDSGIGISDKDIQKIWERFYQADPSRSDNKDGSMGLGLSMVKWIAEAHGGNVTVESEIGKGSTFTFAFPKNK